MVGWIKVVVALSVILVLLFIVLKSEIFHLIKTGDLELISSFINENIFSMLIITFVIMTILNALPIIPVILIITLNNSLFGFYFGYIWSLFTSVLCAIIIFSIIRHGFQDWVLKKVDSKIINKVNQHAVWYIIQVRIFPLAPTSIINAAAGFSNIRLFHFILATTIGNAILFLIYTLIQAGMISGGAYEYVITILVLLLFMTYIFVKKANKKSVKEQ